MSQEPVDLGEAFARLKGSWSPLTVATMNDYDVRVVTAHGEFAQHTHEETDELFLVLSGLLSIRLADGDVHLGPGQLHVVARGVPHQPYSPDGAKVLLIEPSETINTGDVRDERTAPRRVL